MVLQGIGVLEFVHQDRRKAGVDISSEFFGPGSLQGRVHLQEKVIKVEAGLFLLAPPKFLMQIFPGRQQDGDPLAAGHFVVQGDETINQVKKPVFRR